MRNEESSREVRMIEGYLADLGFKNWLHFILVLIAAAPLMYLLMQGICIGLLYLIPEGMTTI